MGKFYLLIVDVDMLDCACAGVVSTLAGSGSGAWADGLGTAASFMDPSGVSVDSNGTVYVADFSGNRIRKVSLSGVLTAHFTGILRVCRMSFMEVGRAGLSVLDFGWMILHW